ncbi:MAG: hypothetical protein ACOCZ3_00890 [Bacillota bacterium]
MYLQLELALLVGSITYMVIVVSGLIRGLVLSRILYRGLTRSFLIGILVWLLILLMKALQNPEAGNDDQPEPADQNSPENRETESEQSEGEDFSPMEPPVLEVEEGEQTELE